jgi:hydrogenase maturation protein HypF
MAKAVRINITGIVQGVGFRPFVYNLAIKHGIVGFCLNDSYGVVIEASGSNLESFIAELASSAPPLAKIDNITVLSAPSSAESGFVIK